MKNRLKRKDFKKGFTLIELIGCISIISILMCILLPALSMARDGAVKICCSSNLRNLGFAMELYSNDFGRLPAAYYSGRKSDGINGAEVIHFSGLLIELGYSNEKDFYCKAIEKNGHVAANESDIQAKRCAFTVNEALCPRNRFEAGVDGALRPSKHVRPEMVRKPQGTILATEWINNASAISDSNGNAMSYLPVHAVKVIGSSKDKYDINMASNETDKPCFRNGSLQYLKAFNISKTQEQLLSNPCRLDWVGRNHGNINNPTTNFLYLDCHTENKTVLETLGRFEWGSRFYSLCGDNRIGH